MIETLYWIAYIITFICFVLGIYIYFKKDLRKKVNMKQVWNFFILISVLRILDVLSTIYFAKKIGVAYEGNLAARLMMSHFGITLGMSTIYLISLPYIFFWFILLNYLFGKNFGWRFFQGLMITVSIIVPLINMSA